MASVDQEGFSISAIPHTVSQTNLHDRHEGDMVNLETDLIGKYVEKLLQPAPEDTRRPITRELLLRYGF